MRVWLFMLSVATLLSVMCADISEITAASRSDASLIERMTRNRKPAPRPRSTLPLENQAESVAPVKRVPLSEVHVEVGSTQPGPPIVLQQQSSTNRQLQVSSKSPVEVDSDKMFDILAPVTRAEPLVANERSAVSDRLPPRSVAVHPTPTTTTIPEVEFESFDDEHIIPLPDTTDDGFIGVPRSQRDAVGQYAPKRDEYYHHPSNDSSRQTKRIRPNFFRRGR